MKKVMMEMTVILMMKKCQTMMKMMSKTVFFL